ncbi:putative bifunctional diguanylate cyclase/phosphodiesterase [Xanthomonas theicola]|nr:EAL domain-containing protein [Xanthomonas theicola]
MQPCFFTDKTREGGSTQRLRQALRAPLRAILVSGMALAAMLACAPACALAQDRADHRPAAGCPAGGAFGLPLRWLPGVRRGPPPGSASLGNAHHGRIGPRRLAVSGGHVFAMPAVAAAAVRAVPSAWRWPAMGAAAVCLLSLAGFTYLLGRLRRAEHRQRRVLDRLHRSEEAEARLLDAERQFRLVFERNPLPYWLFAVDSLRFLEVNQAAIRQYGYSRDEFLGMTLLDLRPPSDAERLLQDVRKPRDGFDEPSVWTHRRKDGSLLSVRIHSADLAFGGIAARLILAEDVGQRVADERALALRASHDVATGLLNPRALAEELDARPQADYAVVYVQLRGLALIGDTLGRAAGDAVRCALAARLRALGARFGLTAHQPSQDFVLAVLDPRQLPQALQALLDAVSAPVHGGGFSQQLHAHVGVALYPQDASGADAVIGSAAQAAHAAQADGRSVARFERGMSARIGERLRLAGRIHQALARQEFQLYFQPIVRLADGAPRLLKALIRWPQADGSFIAPDQFIQLCEDTGLILPLGRWLMRAAAQARRQLALHGWAGLPVAVNVSALQFFDGDLVAELEQACADAGVGADGLCLELTESSLMRQPQQALDVLRQLRARGVRVALDDFGTGFSSMAHLRDLPLDAMKIDRSFVADVHSDARNASICEALLTLGHRLGLQVVAEGVETQAQLQWLRTHGCDHVQGYLLGRPAPLAQVIGTLDPRAALTT